MHLVLLLGGLVVLHHLVAGAARHHLGALVVAHRVGVLLGPTSIHAVRTWLLLMLLVGWVRLLHLIASIPGCFLGARLLIDQLIIIIWQQRLKLQHGRQI